LDSVYISLTHSGERLMPSEPIQDLWPEIGTFCWGCGKNNPHGLQLKSYWADEETVAMWQPKDYHLAFPGVLNGGIIATLIDCHATGTANAVAHRNSMTDKSNHFVYVTGSLQVKYLRPTPLAKPVTLKARVMDATDRKMTVTCSLYSDGIECATGEVVAVRIDASGLFE